MILQSAVDTATERYIKDALYHKYKSMTKIIIAQRMTSVMEADKILVLDNGTIAGLGTHDELVESCAIYKEIYEVQFRKCCCREVKLCRQWVGDRCNAWYRWRKSWCQKKKTKGYPKTILRLFRYMSNTKAALFGALGCVVISTVSSLAASYMLRPIINKHIVEFDRKWWYKRFYCSTYCYVLVYLFVLLLPIFNQINALCITRCIGAIEKRFICSYAEAANFLFDKNSKGDLMSRFTNDVDVVGEMLNNTAVQLLSGMMTLVGTFSMMIYTNIILSMITFVMIPLIICTGRFWFQKAESIMRHSSSLLVRLMVI